VASFFPSIDKRILYDILATAMHDPELLWLTRVILFHDPTQDYRFRSLDGRTPPPGSAGYPVPLRKSLFGKGGQRGLPIGNLTSQFWANVYLDRLDQFVKHTLKCRHYVRYVDDTVLLWTDREQLAAWRGEIEAFLRGRLLLELRPGVDELFPVSRGVDFVGWKSWWSHRVPRRQTRRVRRWRIFATCSRPIRVTFGTVTRERRGRARGAHGRGSRRCSRGTPGPLRCAGRWHA
jgi:hypothetical protein